MLSAWVIALALLMKLLVPAGFMPVVSGGGITIEICAGTVPARTSIEPGMAAKMAAAMPGMTHHQDQSDHQDGSEHQGREMPCAFAGLTAPALAATDLPLLAAAIAFVVATGYRTTVPSVVRAAAFLRPPLRGPPPRA